MGSELTDALRRNYIAYFRLFHGQYGIRVHEDEETAWIIANRPPGNHILRTNFAAARAEERIDALLRTLRSLTGGMRWLLFPSDQPADLGRRLARRGLEPSDGDLWMFRTLDPLPRPERASACRIEPVTDRQGLRAWWRASAEGFGMTQRAAQLWYDVYCRHGFGADAYAINFTGRVGRETVVSATLILAGGIAGIYDLSTLPACRGNGYASALVNRLLDEARRRSYSHAGLQTADSVQFYQRLGFEVGCQEREYIWAAGQGTQNDGRPAPKSAPRRTV